ncbi:MAG: hypothetical protein JNM65_11585, partial [Verrucomicrobiaceae bacterium]|nr:hypothetical protein [Verrucomicrobiaceae bacterium]
MNSREQNPRPLLSRFRGRFARGMLLLGMFLSMLPPVRLRAEDEAPAEPPPVNDTWWGDVWRWVDGGQQWFALQNVGQWGDDDGDDIPNGLDPYPWDASNNTGWLRASNVWSDAVLHETWEWAYAADRSWQLDWYDSDGDGLPNWCDPRPYDSANNTTWWNAQADVDGESRALSAIGQSDIIDWSDYDGDGLPNSFDPYPWDASNNTSRWSLETYIDAILGLHQGMYATSSSWQDMDDDGLPDWADPYVDSAENNTSWWRGGSFYINGAEQWFGDANTPYATAWDDADHDGIPNFADPMPYDAANNTTWWSGEYQIDGSLRQLGGVFAAGGLDWADYDSDGIPNFVDPYLYDSGNNNSNTTAAVTDTTSWYDSYVDTMWQDWGDNDADGLPNFSDPYPNDATNNTTQWSAAQDYLVDGGARTVGGIYATSGLDWNDDDGDELPNFADPYPHDPDNNSALWWAQTWVDGAAQDLIGAYAANADTGTWSDGDEDGLPDWLDPYPEDADNNTAWWWGNAWMDGGMQDIAGTYAANESAAINWEDGDEDGLPDWLDPYPQDAGNNTAWWMDEAYVDGELQTLMASYAADAAPAMSWEDRDFDGLPDWCDPYADDFSNNTLWWEGEFLIDGERVTVGGWFADEGPDWNDDDGDWLPNFMDPYADDPTNNTAFWNGAAWIDGKWQEIAEPYPASSAALLDLSDSDEDTLPDVFDPYPEDGSNNTAVWNGGEFVIDGETRTLSGAGVRYAADGGDVDGDHIPDFADPYAEDAGNDGREPVFGEPVNGASVNGGTVDGASVGASSSGGISAPSGAASGTTSSTTPPAVPPPALDDAALLALLGTGSLPAPQTQGEGTAPDEAPPDPLSAASAAEVEQLVLQIADLAQRPRAFSVETDAQALALVVQTLVVEPGADPAAALAAALAFRQTPQVTAQDSDGDGLDDLEETLTYLTDLTNPDTDGDGFFDGWEIDYSLDPLDADDNATADTDNDGLSNEEELAAGTHPLHADSDYGGVIDGIETRVARLRALLGENTPQEYSAANPLDPQDDVPQDNGSTEREEDDPEDPEDTDDDTHTEQDENEDMGNEVTPTTGGGTPPGTGGEGMDDEEQDGQDEQPQDMDDPGQPPPPEEPQETLREKWAREKREREAVLQERRDRLHEEHVAGVEQRAAAREQQREMNHHLSHPHGNHGVGVKNAGSRGLFDSSQRPLAFEPTAQYALSHGYDNVTRTWLNPRPANESPEDRNTRLAQDWLERKALRDQQRVFWHPHGNHGNGVINPGARGLQTADNLDGALAFQASADYAQSEANKRQSFENALFQLVR